MPKLVPLAPSGKQNYLGFGVARTTGTISDPLKIENKHKMKVNIWQHSHREAGQGITALISSLQISRPALPCVWHSPDRHSIAWLRFLIWGQLPHMTHSSRSRRSLWSLRRMASDPCHTTWAFPRTSWSLDASWVNGEKVYAYLLHRFIMRTHRDRGHERTSRYKRNRRGPNRQLCFLRSPHPTVKETVSDSAVTREAESILTLDPFYK